jgi:hypothetical protein
MILEVEETKIGQDPVRTSGKENARIKEYGISEFSESVLRSSISHSCVAKQCIKKQVVTFKQAMTRQMQEGSAVVLSSAVVVT